MIYTFFRLSLLSVGKNSSNTLTSCTCRGHVWIGIGRAMAWGAGSVHGRVLIAHRVDGQVAYWLGPHVLGRGHRVRFQFRHLKVLLSCLRQNGVEVVEGEGGCR